MSGDTARRAEWDLLLEERAALRGDLARTLGALDAKARDPRGLREMFRRQPLLYAGIAAAVGAVLVGVLMPGRSAKRDVEPPPPRDPSSPIVAAPLRTGTTTVTSGTGPAWGSRVIDTARAIRAAR